MLLLLVGCLTSQQHASVSLGRICTDNFTCCHTEIEVADQTFHLTQSQYTDTGPISPSADPITPSAWQGSHWTANFLVTGFSALEVNALPLGQRGGQCQWEDCVVRCEYVVTEWNSKINLQLRFQCGTVQYCLARTAPEMRCSGDVKQPNNNNDNNNYSNRYNKHLDPESAVTTVVSCAY